MKATEEGIEVSKAELTALLAFTGMLEPFSCVHFAVPKHTQKLTVSATDGQRACEVFSQTDDQKAVSGEWTVVREFLDTCKRALTKGEICILQVTKSGLKSAVVRDVESGQSKGTISWPHDAASTQITIEKIRAITRLERRLSGSWFAINPAYLRDIAVMSSACGGRPVSIYTPKDPISPIFFEAEGYEAQWTGVVMPVRVETPGGKPAEENEEGREKTELEEALEELAELEDENR